MQAWQDLGDIKAFFWALAWTQPRILGLFMTVPIFQTELLPHMLRYGVAAVLGLVVAPSLVSDLAATEIPPTVMLVLAAKEVFVGFVLGCFIAVPFWAFEAVGFFIDNQRGASIASTLNPLTGNDSSPLGILFNQAFIVFFLVSGAFLLLLDVLYGSFRLWPVLTWMPTFRPEAVPFFLEEIFGLVRMALLLAAPAVVAMLLAEIGLALVSLVVPQLQVFFLAMPIKSAVVFLVQVVYMGTLFEYAGDTLKPLRDLLPRLDAQWGVIPEGRR